MAGGRTENGIDEKELIKVGTPTHIYTGTMLLLYSWQDEKMQGYGIDNDM